MRPLSARQMLAVWERGQNQIPLQRALTILQAACPECEPQRLAALSVGQRDTRLLTLREWAFGSGITGCTWCPQCRELLEFRFQLSDFRQHINDSEIAPVACSLSGYELVLRPINSLDLMPCPVVDTTIVRRRLFESCLLSARLGDTPVSHDQVPDQIALSALETVTRADEPADLQIEASCANCSHYFRESFDIVAFFWSEIDIWARRILREVHLLASAYGWTENEVLGLSPLRRQLYLEMVSA
jgi:hypothetical protein